MAGIIIGTVHRTEIPALNTISTTALWVSLVALLIAIGYFAGTETALMSLNRYRLRHRAEAGQRAARLTEKLLRKPDALIGVILLGAALTNVMAPAVLTMIVQKLGGGERMVFASVLGLGAFIFVFCELAPKTYGVFQAERLALPSAYVYRPLLLVFTPLIWIANRLVRALLRLVGMSAEQAAGHSLSADELRTAVAEAAVSVPQRHRQMLVSILDLERVTVDDIMIPRNDVTGIDINDDWDQILEQLRQAQHTRIPLYEGELDQLIGLLHMKNVARELARGKLSRDLLIEIARAREAYFVPEGTTLNIQLSNFQRNRRRTAFVVDEYGDVQGLVTLEDILEEIVGEFTTDTASLMHKDVHRATDGSFVINASATVRALNRAMHWKLPTEGPKTLNGLIVEHLQAIPEPGTALRIGDYAIEVMQTADNVAKTVRLREIAARDDDQK
ncbi:MAG TPA: HlyC/CorC family transporter [Steroidobacteraceae bacterium]|nr:HlyC/CorC family transporter [Steroidobacteraceae bacterium]